MKTFFCILIFVAFFKQSVGQTIDIKTNYELAFDEMHQMLRGEVPLSLKRAVFLTENAYLENEIRYEDFQKAIEAIARMAKVVATNDGMIYNKKDKQQVLLAGSIYRVMKDTLVFENTENSTGFKKYPYTYDTTDFWGEKDWTKMFVTKLLYTQTGNCHSLPILYKILAQELGVEAWLSITPNHTYIKQWSDKDGWYNTELTSGRFPYDAEIKNNSYIKTEAIVAGVYMDTLTEKENISYAITDLAQGYIRKFGYGDITTPLRWLEAALIYYPDFPNALIFKSELLKKEYEKAVTKKGENDYLKPKDIGLKKKYEELEQSYYAAHQTGYRRMPKEMYLNWLYRMKKDTTRKPHKFESPQPFKDYGYNVLVMTASDGYNYEFYDQEETTRIGTVEINRLTGKIVKFIEPDKDDFPDEVISRMYDPYVGRFWQVDPLADEYYNISPYTYVMNNPVNAIDPDGRRVYFIGGAGNDSDGWSYITRWQGAFANSGINDFHRVNQTRGQAADIAFTSSYRHSGYEFIRRPNSMNNYVGGLSPAAFETTGEQRPVQNEVIDNTVSYYQQHLKDNPLGEGEQFNLAGYSYGSVLQAQVALKLANSGQVIDNLVLIGSPVGDNSDLYKQLSGNKNIKNIIRYDLKGDALSNPQDVYDFIKGGGQGLFQGDNAPHFDAARPGNEADKLMGVIVEWLKQQGVKN